MNESQSGLRLIDGVRVVPLDGLWGAVRRAPDESKMSAAIAYSGAEFYDEEQRFVAKSSVAIVGLGGSALASSLDSDEYIKDRMRTTVERSREMMATSASLSYLNSGEQAQDVLYRKVISLGHYSVAHTVSVNVMLAGISQAAELEISLQRDLLHISKVTNTRTKVQGNPPLVVQNPRYLEVAQRIAEVTSAAVEEGRSDYSPDELEALNGLFPVNKASIIMLTGDLSNFRKFAAIRADEGKEKEVRDVAAQVNDQLGLLWPEIFNSMEK